ncbi:hypothetical protein TSUD_305450 [Trifolium subterraneum]|uniref:Uncharacterized protein n=1 Tax=Trifolium subterraneum TaxID=3900 RepID=A0A2Z6NZ51_TRISU|nr:hypothetical protein TSUD_305450 [Trifolium subterraneum]
MVLLQQMCMLLEALMENGRGLEELRGVLERLLYVRWHRFKSMELHVNYFLAIRAINSNRCSSLIGRPLVMKIDRLLAMDLEASCGED